MTRKLFFVTAFSVLLAACQGQHEGVAYNVEVIKALQQHEATLKQKRTELQFDSGASAQTCEDYLRLSATETLKEDVANQLVKSEYLVCDVLALVGKKKLGSGHPDGNFGQVLAERVDLRSFPSSLHQMLDEKKFSLKQLGTNAVKKDARAASYDTQDWHYRLELVATLDVNNNGKADWVVWLADEAKDGNYRQYQTLVIHDVSKTGLLNAVPYVYKMKKAAAED